MEFTKGYFYSKRTDAENAVKEINQMEGFPNDDYTTSTYCELIECIGGWYILHDEITSKYLKDAIDIELIKKIKEEL